MPTLQAIYRALGEELGPFGTVTTSDAATGPDPARWAICRGSTAHATTAGALGDRYAGGWLYVASGAQAGQQRRVAWSAPEVGGLLVDAVFGGTLATSVSLDIGGPLPVTRVQDVVGLKQLAVQALRDLWTPSRYNLTTVSNQQSYTLPAWIDREDRILGLYDPPRASGFTRPPSRLTWRYVAGSTPALQLIDRAYPVGGFTAQIEARRPLYTLVNGSESSVGPSADADEVLGETDEIVTVALLHAYRWLSGWGQLPPEERERFASLVPQQREAAERLPHYLPERRVATEEAA